MMRVRIGTINHRFQKQVFGRGSRHHARLYQMTQLICPGARKVSGLFRFLSRLHILDSIKNCSAVVRTSWFIIFQFYASVILLRCLEHFSDEDTCFQFQENCTFRNYSLYKIMYYGVILFIMYSLCMLIFEPRKVVLRDHWIWGSPQ